MLCHALSTWRNPMATWWAAHKQVRLLRFALCFAPRPVHVATLTTVRSTLNLLTRNLPRASQALWEHLIVQAFLGAETLTGGEILGLQMRLHQSNSCTSCSLRSKTTCQHWSSSTPKSMPWDVSSSASDKGISIYIYIIRSWPWTTPRYSRQALFQRMEKTRRTHELECTYETSRHCLWCNNLSTTLVKDKNKRTLVSDGCQRLMSLRDTALR